MQVDRFGDQLEDHGVSRRDFMVFCAAMASILGLPAPAIAAAVQGPKKPILVWLEFQDCAGDSESLLRASHPTVAELLLDSISLNYHETLMAAAGSQAEEALAHTLRDYAGNYIALVEGSIPTGADGAYCMIGGKSALQMAREVCGQAAAVVAVGSCAAFGGLPAAKPNPTGALSVGDAVPGIANLVNLSACPANAENIAALIVYYMTLKRWPPMDRYHRPLFAYGKTIHDNCERRAHFDAGQYVEAWGDEAHRQGHCLYKLGCKGPATSHNCPVVRWNEGSNWPVGCGHPCIGCAEPDFWDTMTPLYGRLPDVAGYDVGRWVDPAGLALTGLTAAGVAMHGVGEVVLRHFRKKPPEAAEQPEPAPEAKE
jgi:hydrogenase small subunit